MPEAESPNRMVTKQIAVLESDHGLAKSMAQALNKDIGEVTGLALKAKFASLPSKVKKAIEVLRAAQASAS